MRTADRVLVWLTVNGNANVMFHEWPIHVKGPLPAGPVRMPIDSRSSSRDREDLRQPRRWERRLHIEPTAHSSSRSQVWRWRKRFRHLVYCLAGVPCKLLCIHCYSLYCVSMLFWGKIKSRVDFSYPGNKGENHIWIEHPLTKNAFMPKFKNEFKK